MGIIRKSLYLASGGLVAPNSRKQKLAMQQLAALQGATPEEVRRRGARSDYDGFFGLPPASVTAREKAMKAEEMAARAAGPPSSSGAAMPQGSYKKLRPCPGGCGTYVRGLAGMYRDRKDNPHLCAGLRSK